MKEKHNSITLDKSSFFRYQTTQYINNKQNTNATTSTTNSNFLSFYTGPEPNTRQALSHHHSTTQNKQHEQEAVNIEFNITPSKHPKLGSRRLKDTDPPLPEWYRALEPQLRRPSTKLSP